jgi:serine/threonine-protein kinase
VPVKRSLRPRQRLGKYRIGKRIAEGGFAEVYQAYDTIEGIDVALKLPKPSIVDEALLDDFKKEVRLTARLDHPNIQPIKNASYIGTRFVIVYPLGERCLGDRLRQRLSVEKALDYGEGMLAGLAHAHGHRVIHCDVKPENLILFSDGRLRLTDFGIAKLALRTMRASGSGTLGYVAPEQAMGRPSARSDVFSAGLVLYRMLASQLPEWPYEWPPKGFERLQKRVHPSLVSVIRRALKPDPRQRYEDARVMLEAFQRARRKQRASKLKTAASSGRNGARRTSDWKTVRRRQFQREHRRELETVHTCARCTGPVSEPMTTCPWCGAGRKTFRGETTYPAACPRCKRGVKLDWAYCAWCYGAAIGPLSKRTYRDRRYAGRCSNRGCGRRELLPFARYCPWCRTKVKRPWKIASTRSKCPRCRSGVLPGYWSHCPWCSRALKARSGKA